MGCAPAWADRPAPQLAVHRPTRPRGAQAAAEEMPEYRAGENYAALHLQPATEIHGPPSPDPPQTGSADGAGAA